MMALDPTVAKRILALHERMKGHFTLENWQQIGLITDNIDLITKHDRLLRSLHFGDDDYAGHALSVLRQIVAKDPGAIDRIENYVDLHYPVEDGVFVSAKRVDRKLTFAPSVFLLPEDLAVDPLLVSVMMPFDASFDPVRRAIATACESNGMKCVRADDIWEESTIIQDIFNLILRSRVVVVDFTGRNSNVMYETGIAHTLGKTVVPITQSMEDVPFDVKPHRAARYLSNKQGLRDLAKVLTKKLAQFSKGLGDDAELDDETPSRSRR
jgi:hypothetical protein